jgi:hypothetical protein
MLQALMYKGYSVQTPRSAGRCLCPALRCLPLCVCNLDATGQGLAEMSQAGAAKPELE